MNDQTFSNQQFRPLLNFFHSIHIGLRDTSGDIKPFVSVRITHLVLKFRKASNIHFQPRRRYRMVASGQVKIPFYRSNGRQRGRGFAELAQVIGRTAITFLCKKSVPVAKRVCADLLTFALPENADNVSGRKNVRTAAENVGRQTRR